MLAKKRYLVLLFLCLLSVFPGSQRLLFKGVSPLRCLTTTSSNSRRALSAPNASSSLRPASPAYYRSLIHIHTLKVGEEKGELYNPYFQYVLHPPDGAYPVLAVADAFLRCTPGKPRAIMLMSRHYFRTPDLNHSEVALEVLLAGGRTVALPPCHWFKSIMYETIAVGTCEYDPGDELCTPNNTPGKHLSVRATYREHSAVFNISAPPQPPPSDWALVAVFSFSRYFLVLWMQYWRALGVDTFYLFYNGREEDIPDLQAEVAGIEASVTIISWQMVHWIMTDSSDNTHGQPIAINSAIHRWKHLHKWMAFYDTDEFPVFPNHNNLNHFVERFSAEVEPIVAVRTQCSWGMVNFSTPIAASLNVSNITGVTLPMLTQLTIDRGPPGGREKYLLNTSAIDAWGIGRINIHGLYDHQRGGGGAAGQAVILMPWGKHEAFHLHLLNAVSLYFFPPFFCLFAPSFSPLYSSPPFAPSTSLLCRWMTAERWTAERCLCPRWARRSGTRRWGS